MQHWRWQTVSFQANIDVTYLRIFNHRINSSFYFQSNWSITKSVQWGYDSRSFWRTALSDLPYICSVTDVIDLWFVFVFGEYWNLMFARVQIVTVLSHHAQTLIFRILWSNAVTVTSLIAHLGETEVLGIWFTNWVAIRILIFRNRKAVVLAVWILYWVTGGGIRQCWRTQTQKKCHNEWFEDHVVSHASRMN